MITLITGTPGAGKTAYAMMMLRDLLEREPRKRVFVVGVPDLQLPHELAPPPEEWVVAARDEATGVAFERWAFPDGSLIIIDECQTVYRPRASSSRVPPHVAALERHRHQGLDFWLITQNPNLIDSNVRNLVGKHVHLRSTWAGRRLLEWPEATNPGSRSERTAAVSRNYKLPKSVFSLYKSATIHVKQSRRLPVMVYVMAGAVLLFGLGAWYLYRSIAPRVLPALHTSSGLDSVVSDSSSSRSVSSSGASSHVVRVSDFVPRLASFPETAPLYDSDRKVHQIPHVVGCVATADRCSCFTQQGTDAFLSVDQCRAFLASRPFNPFLEPVAPSGGSSTAVASVPDASVGVSEPAPRSSRVAVISDSDSVSSFAQRSYGGLSGSGSASFGGGGGAAGGGAAGGGGGAAGGRSGAGARHSFR